MVDPWIHGTTDPFPADIGDYICPITAVFAGGECGAAESVVSRIGNQDKGQELVLLTVCVANCCSSCYRELINPSAVSMPTEFVQLDWRFSHDASNFSRRITDK